MFKVGDRVRRIEESHYPQEYGEVGKEYEILSVDSDGCIQIFPNTSYAASHYFELVSHVEIPSRSNPIVDKYKCHCYIVDIMKRGCNCGGI